MKKILLFLSVPFLFLALASPSFFEKNKPAPQYWSPDAGVVPSFTDGAKVTASSNQKEAWKILDGNFETAWQSVAPLPEAFLKNGSQNLWLHRVDIFEDKKEGFGKCVDGDLNTPAQFFSKNKNWVKWPEKAAGQSIFLKCQVASPLEIWGHFPDGKKEKLGEYVPGENFKLKKVKLSNSVEYEFLELKNEKDFLLFETALLAEPFTEAVLFDFGKIKNVGVLKTRHWAGEGTAVSTKAFLSTDGKNWKMAAELDPSAQHPVLTALAEEVPARFLKIEHEMVEREWNKVFLWEVDAYDRHGPYGPRPVANMGAVKLREMLGVNGYWSWGTKTCSADLPKGEGPWRYASVASHGRNYHDLTWDIERPGQPIDFSKMENQGTPAKEWVNWDREYATWVEAGMNVQASFQFFRFEPGQWADPEKEAFQYAQSFVRHFGLAHGNGLVCSIEAGNEPWKYPADVYRKILLGVAKGAKATDPGMEVFPCALQAADPTAEETDVFKNYIGARLPPEAAGYLDGINIHAYSYLTDQKGNRRAVHPEHPQSTFWEILNAIQWRDENMPGKKIYLSEWGWDSGGGGQDCTHSECVSEAASANYAIRGAMIAARLGIERATWFFYANTEPQSSLYTRSGLTSSEAFGFEKKRAFTALQSLVELAGGSYFQKVIREDETAWAYQLADKNGKPTHIISWRPVPGDEKAGNEIELKIPQKITKAIRLNGSETGGEVGLPKHSKGIYYINNFSTPTLFMLE